jgi:hypothetical protein
MYINLIAKVGLEKTLLWTFKYKILAALCNNRILDIRKYCSLKEEVLIEGLRNLFSQILLLAMEVAIILVEVEVVVQARKLLLGKRQIFLEI